MTILKVMIHKIFEVFGF